MTAGQKLLIRGNYGDAIPLLEAEAKRDWQDDFKAGAVYDLGIAMLLTQRFDDAERHFQKLISKSLRSVSGHYLFLGAAKWFHGNHKAAIPFWEKAESCDYQSHKGLDVATAFYFAAIRDPKTCSLNSALNRFEKVSQRLYPHAYPAWIADFVLDRFRPDEFLARMSSWTGKNSAQWIPSLQAIGHYYVGLKKLQCGNERDYWKHLRSCALPGNYVSLFDEMVFARLELLHHGENPAAEAETTETAKRLLSGKTKGVADLRQSSKSGGTKPPAAKSASQKRTQKKTKP